MKQSRSRGKTFLSWTELKLPVRAQDTGDWHRGLLRIGATFPVMWMLYRSAVERGLIVKWRCLRIRWGVISTLAEERLGVLLDQLKVVTGEREGCLGVSATTSETWTWDKWWIDRWLGYSGNQIPDVHWSASKRCDKHIVPCFYCEVEC